MSAAPRPLVIDLFNAHLADRGDLRTLVKRDRHPFELPAGRLTPSSGRVAAVTRERAREVSSSSSTSRHRRCVPSPTSER